MLLFLLIVLFVCFFLSRCTRLKCTTARQENKCTNSVPVTTGSISFHSWKKKKGKKNPRDVKATVSVFQVWSHFFTFWRGGGLVLFITWTTKKSQKKKINSRRKLFYLIECTHRSLTVSVSVVSDEEEEITATFRRTAALQDRSWTERFSPSRGYQSRVALSWSQTN